MCCGNPEEGECGLMGASGKASERRHKLPLTLKEQETVTTLPLPKNYSLSLCLLFAGDSGKITGRDGGSCSSEMHSLLGHEPGTAEPIGTLCLQMDDGGGRVPPCGLREPRLPELLLSHTQSTLFTKRVPALQRCLKRFSPLISFPLPGSVWRELVEFE